MMPEQILLALKDNLQITWEDDTTNRALLRFIANGQAFLNGLCEAELTYEEGSQAYELLLERCRYAWNNAVDEFEENFKRDLQRLILKTALSKRKVGEDVEQAEDSANAE